MKQINQRTVINKKLPSANGGYTAISAVLVITAVLFAISLTTTTVSIDDMQNSLGTKKADESLVLVEGCAEDALLRLNQNGALPGSITIPEGTCTITTNSQVGNTWDFTVTATFETYTKSIRIVAIRTSLVSIQSWREI